jgi:hypothetical protein
MLRSLPSTWSWPGLRVVAGLLVALLTAPTATALAAPYAQVASEARTVEPAGPPAAPAQPAPMDLDTYARREAAAAGLEGFEGGSVGIYIGGSTLAIVLLIVLLIILL